MSSWRIFHSFVIGAALLVSGCSTNPATGDRQFTALMSPGQELQVGRQEHAKIIKQIGEVKNPQLKAYVNRIGQNIVQYTERPDVNYTFTVLDSPMVNAFAVPGGYIYITRGILMLANDEAELAAVISHEIGHITARHSAERYSRTVLASIGGAALGIALDNPEASKMANLGSELYLKSYSRGQEHQADTLGIRYMASAGYDPKAMSSFLKSLERQVALEKAEAGQGTKQQTNYFSTHPLTSDRISKTIEEASVKVPANPVSNREAYLRQIKGMVYADSSTQGFVRGQDFIHPEMAFRFSVPAGYTLKNAADKVVAVSRSGGLIIFDSHTPDRYGSDPYIYIKDMWGAKAPIKGVERITVNGKRGATASFSGTVDRKAMNIRLVAVEWEPGTYYRFQLATPVAELSSRAQELKRTTYSLKQMTSAEKKRYKALKIRIHKARSGESVASLSRTMPHGQYNAARFRVINGMFQNEAVRAGRSYKIIVE